jgi:hypothetical protein
MKRRHQLRKEFEETLLYKIAHQEHNNFNKKEHNKNKITEKYTSTRDTTFILGNPLGEENPAKTSLS